MHVPQDSFKILNFAAKQGLREAIGWKKENAKKNNINLSSWIGTYII